MPRLMCTYTGKLCRNQRSYCQLHPKRTIIVLVSCRFLKLNKKMFSCILNTLEEPAHCSKRYHSRRCTMLDTITSVATSLSATASTAAAWHAVRKRHAEREHSGTPRPWPGGKSSLKPYNENRGQSSVHATVRLKTTPRWTNVPITLSYTLGDSMVQCHMLMRFGHPSIGLAQGESTPLLL